MQKQLHQKLHSYQMFSAMSKGYMPSTEQIIINLRTFLATDLLNSQNTELSPSGRKLVRYTREWLKAFIEIMRRKNGKDQIQDFIWYTSKSDISIDTKHISQQASRVKARADAAAAYESFRTVGSLLLTNSDFRLFLDDLGTIGRQILSDSAFALSGAAKEAGNKLELSEEDAQKLSGPGADDGPKPTTEDLGNEVADVSKIVGDGLVQTGRQTVVNAKEHLHSDEGETLVHRLKQAILKLRSRHDYSDSVSTIAQLIQRYAITYSKVAESTLSTVQDGVEPNPALDRAVKNFWSFVSSFGDPKEWDKLKDSFEKVMSHAQSDPDFESFMNDVGNAVQSLLTDPDFFEHADSKLTELREKSQSGTKSDFRKDLDALLQQGQITIRTVYEDKDISNLIISAKRIIDVVSPPNSVTNPDLVTDAIHIFIPLLIRTVQYIPIPRIEVSVPEIDLLLENVILEPGRTVNSTSFLPYRLLVSTKNDLEIRKAHSKKTTSNTKSLVTATVNGISICANDLGFWLRAHAGPLFRFADEGIASFALDERGIDISLDLEVGRERLEQILTLRGVKVHIHKLDYTLRKSKLSWIGWIFKPFLKQLIRRVLEKQLAMAIANALHAANRELVFARERLRATRVADPKDVMTFVKAVMARLSPKEDPDVYTRVGVDAPGAGRFKGVYTPGSILKVWHEEADRAEEAVEIGEERGGGWRNAVFDVGVY